MRNMSFKVPKEFVEIEEAVTKMTSFWLKPGVLKRLDAVCSVNHVSRSKVFRLMADLFVNDIEFQDRVMEGAKNNG